MCVCLLLLGVVFKAAAQRNHTLRAGKQKNINTLLVCSFVRASTCPSPPSLSCPPSPSILVANFPLSLPFPYVSSVTHPSPCLCVFPPLLFLTIPASLLSTCGCSLLPISFLLTSFSFHFIYPIHVPPSPSWTFSVPVFFPPLCISLTP